MSTKFLSENNLSFLLYDVFDVSQLFKYEIYKHHDRKIFDMVLFEALKMSKELMWPVLSEMDKLVPSLSEGKVKVHPIVKKIMKECGNGGWIGASFNEKHGGEQLPIIIYNCIKFIFAAANYSASVYPDLTAAAARLITTFGDKSAIEEYVPNMLAGKWQGTMALTEPEAGCSLADISTAAIPTNLSNTYLIKGQKVFISAGDHDGAENIIHLLLAKIKNGPEGVKGLSLFIVPKKIKNKKGDLVTNGIETSQIFHKLGYRGTPITELIFGARENCHGVLLGKPHDGLKYMFNMMNEARIGVGIGATGIASAAYYSSLEYAKKRKQGRKLNKKTDQNSPVCIIEHPDIKRMLLSQRCIIEGSLSLILQCSKYADLEKTTKGEEKKKNALLLDILTPVAKTYPSEMSIKTTSDAIQIFGGYGYCEDFPVEQYYRDARIHPIHEGTTGIQGLDLLGRKVIMHDGKAFQIFMKEVSKIIGEAEKYKMLSDWAQQLKVAIETLEKVTNYKIAQKQKNGIEVFLADATVYLEMFSIVAIAWQWLLQALTAAKKMAIASKKNTKFLNGKLTTCRFFFGYEVPKLLSLKSILMNDGSFPATVDVDYFNE